MRTLLDANQLEWKAELISHGQTSGYLNPRVHNPIVQFTCLGKALAHRYVAFANAANRSIEDCSDEELMDLFRQAATH